MRRVLLRTVKGYGRARPGLPDNCPERFDLAFLRYVWEFPRKQRPRIEAAIDQFGSNLRVTRLGRDAEVEEFLAGLGVP